MIGKFREFTQFIRHGNIGKWILLGMLLGLLTGLAASGFFYLLEWAKFLFLDFMAGYPPQHPAGEQLFAATSGSPPRPVLFFFIPALGGLVSGVLVFLLAPEAAGAGTNAMIDAFHYRRGHIRARVPFVKSLASIVTLATNGSAGRQGPIVHVGAGIGSTVGRILKLPVRDIRLMTLAGAAGGLSAIFKAPLGSALFSNEVLYNEDFETEGIIPCVISAVAAYTVFSAFFGHQSIFLTPDFHFVYGRELLLYALLGLLCAGVGRAYIWFFFELRSRFFERIPIPPHFKPAIGGLCVGLIGLFVPQALGCGYGWLQLAILGELSVGLMASIVLFKIMSTSFTISSGGSGGVFVPSLFIGGMLGGVVGGIGHQLFPQAIHDPEAFVLVGMAAFFAGVAKTPLGAILMVCEMTGSYHLLAPLLLSSAIHLMLNRHVSIYRSQVYNRFSSPAHLGDMTINVLREIQVSEVYDTEQKVVVLPQGMRFGDLREIIETSEDLDFPVVDEANRLKGILSLNRLRQVLFEESLGDLVVVGELASKPYFVRPDEDLYTALQRFLESGHEQLPVVEDHDEGQRIVGILHHKDVISAYHREIDRRTKTEH
jgi:CIC family chloride channel protein